MEKTFSLVVFTNYPEHNKIFVIDNKLISDKIRSLLQEFDNKCINGDYDLSTKESQDNATLLFDLFETNPEYYSGENKELQGLFAHTLLVSKDFRSFVTTHVYNIAQCL